ncbi:MAG: hypothetical protein D3904_03370 [Candidatus Electrothrix sp. EH2]|nr:hypothetical protein [Candidatus Electrothrix sp. EH2]
MTGVCVSTLLQEKKINGQKMSPETDKKCHEGRKKENRTAAFPLQAISAEHESVNSYPYLSKEIKVL